MDINWYPGHMAKAKRVMEENLRLIDIIIELLDARAPRSSMNPDLQKLYKNKPRLIVLIKSDLADEQMTKEWLKHLRGTNEHAIDVNCLDNRSVNKVKRWVNNFADERREDYKKRRGINKTIRAMVVGIPNVGKSTFINALSGGRKTKVGNRPGVTKGKQWIGISRYFEILDTPGVLWPNIDNEEVAFNLACIGSIRDEIIDFEKLAVNLIEIMKEKYPKYISDYYGLDDLNIPSTEILHDICKNRGWLGQGGGVNTRLGSRHILRDFQSAKLGNITLETP